jgi:hypothetical protein
VVVLGLATGTHPGDGGALRDDSIVLSRFGHFFHGHIRASLVCLPLMNNRDLWLRTIAVASDQSGESAWVLADARASLLSRGPVRSHGCTVIRHCAAVVSSG